MPVRRVFTWEKQYSSRRRQPAMKWSTIQTHKKWIELLNKIMGGGKLFWVGSMAVHAAFRRQKVVQLPIKPYTKKGETIPHVEHCENLFVTVRSSHISTKLSSAWRALNTLQMRSWSALKSVHLKYSNESMSVWYIAYLLWERIISKPRPRLRVAKNSVRIQYFRFSHTLLREDVFTTFYAY